MVNYTDSHIPTLKLQTDQSFSSRVMKKYNWAFASEKRVKLQHRQEHNDKPVTQPNVVLSPQIHVHQVIQPLHLNILMQHLTFSQIPIYKQQLIVTPEEVEQRKGNIFVKQPKSIINLNNQVDNQKNTQTTINNGHKINTQVNQHNTHINAQLNQQINNKLINEQREEKIDNSYVDNKTNTQQLVNVQSTQNLVKQFQYRQNQLRTSSLLLNQITQFYKEDKLISQLILQNEQKSLLLNIENQSNIMQQPLIEIKQDLQSNQQTFLEITSTKQDIQKLETNATQVNHSLTVIHKPIQFVWHSRVAAFHMGQQRASEANIDINSNLSLVTKQVSQTKLEHTQISTLNQIRNLSNIKRIKQNTVLKPIKLTIEQYNLVKSNPLLITNWQSEQLKLNTVVVQQALTKPSIMQHTNHSQTIQQVEQVQQQVQQQVQEQVQQQVQQLVQQQVNSHSIQANEEQPAQKSRRGRPRKNSPSEQKIVNEIQYKNNNEEPNDLQPISEVTIINKVEPTVTVLEQKNNSKLTYKDASDSRDARQPSQQLQSQLKSHSQSSELTQVVQNMSDQIVQSQLSIHVEKIKQRYERHAKPIKLVLEKISSVQKFEQFTIQSKQANDHNKHSFIKATIKQPAAVIHKEVTKEDIKERLTKIDYKSINVNNEQMIVHSHTEQNVSSTITEQTRLNTHTEHTFLTHKQEQTEKKKVNVIQRKSLISLTKHNISISKHKLVRKEMPLIRTNAQTINRISKVNQVQSNKQVQVNRVQVNENHLIQREQHMGMLNSQHTLDDLKTLNRQLLEPENVHVRLHVKQQQTESKTVVFNQVEQLKQQVQQMETQIELQNESLKHANERLNVKQLSNQLYEELTRRLKFEKQRMGR